MMGFTLRTCCWLAGIELWTANDSCFFYKWLTSWDADTHFQGKNTSICQLAKSCSKIKTMFLCLQGYHLLKPTTWSKIPPRIEHAALCLLRCPTHRANYTPGHLFSHLQVGPIWINKQWLPSCDNMITSKIPSPRNTGTTNCQLYMPYVLSKGTMAWWWTKNEALFPKKTCVWWKTSIIIYSDAII